MIASQNRLWLPALLTMLVWGCDVRTGRPEPYEQIQAAIESYLGSRTDLTMSSMRVRVENVQIDGDRATAKVSISARDDQNARMEMTYQLRQRDGRWEVEPRAPGGGPQGGAVPPGHPPVNAPPSDSPGELPPDHPPGTP